MTRILPDESWFQGAVSFERGDGFIKPWRIFHEDKALFPPEENVPARAERAAGIRLRFRTDSPFVECFAELGGAEDPPVVDLVHEGEILQTRAISADSGFVRFEGLGNAMRVFELWLPQFAAVRVRGLGVEEGAALESVSDERPRWVAYGSSITHCRAAESPARTWPAVAARQCGLNLVCLGYGGSCHLEPMVGRMIRDLPADVITLKLGINVYGSAALTRRTFQAAAIGLVMLIREKHPKVPIGLITPIFSPPREAQPNGVGLTLEDYREELRQAFGRLKAHGDGRLFLIEGTDLLGPGEANHLPDELHPNDAGYGLMGRRAADGILTKLLQARAGV